MKPKVGDFVEMGMRGSNAIWICQVLEDLGPSAPNKYLNLRVYCFKNKLVMRFLYDEFKRFVDEDEIVLHILSTL